MESLVLVLRYSISNEDLVSLVDGGVVDDIPEGNEEDGNQRKDNGSGEFASAAEGILDEPVHEEAGSDVEWDQKSNGDDWEPPGNLIIKDEEEVPGDVIEGEDHSKATNELDSELNWAAAAAGELVSQIVVANAHAAAACGKLFFSW